jgi:hypothetical protein
MSDNGFAEGLACGQGMNGGYGCGGGFGWGGDWIALIFLAAIFGGGGWGGGFGGGGANVFGEVQRGFDTTGINNKLNGLENGLCDGFYAQNTNLLNGFSGISREIADCCCTTNRNIDQLRFDTERQNCETRRAIDANTDRILGYLTNQEMDRLRAENQALRFSASQSAQNAYLINELRPTAKPAYITCSPFAGAFGWNNGGNACGFGCA